MATGKPRFSVTFTDDSYVKIKKYQKEHNISTQSKAVARLVELAISEIEAEISEKKYGAGDTAPLEEHPEAESLSSALLCNFDLLNQEGQERLMETSDDMVKSGKYIKSDAIGLDKEA